MNSEKTLVISLRLSLPAAASGVTNNRIALCTSRRSDPPSADVGGILTELTGGFFCDAVAYMGALLITKTSKQNHTVPAKQ